MGCVDATNNPQVESSTDFKKLSAMRVELQTQQNYADVITEMITFHTLTTDGAGDICESLKEDLANTQQFISDKVPNTYYTQSSNAHHAIGYRNL